MIKQALEYLLSLADENVLEIDGLPYTRNKLYSVRPPTPEPLKVNTLRSIVEYTHEVMKESDRKNHFLHIVSESTVMLLSDLDGWNQRETLVMATTEAYPQLFKFGAKYAIPDFLIALQSSFVPTEELTTLVRILSNIQVGKIKTSVDDGVSQTVLTKQGSTLLSEEKCPNPIVLHPWRTFREIDQPASSFVFRLHGNGDSLPLCSLHEADGSAWKLEAINSIARLLQDLTKITVIA